MTLGQRIYQLRTKMHLSQGDLADKLEVSRQSVSKWETDASVPELDKLVDAVCLRLGRPQLREHPLFRRTVACHRKND